MKNLLILFLFLSFFSCKDDPIVSSGPVDLTSCFSPNFGEIEQEQFFFDLKTGELQINIDSNITSNNVGYSIKEGFNTVFVYRHFLENSFDIIDDEVEVRILFEVDAGINSFNINSAQEFEKSNCVYAECGRALQTITGSINGTKNADGNWHIEADLEVDRFSKIKMVQINAIFVF